MKLQVLLLSIAGSIALLGGCERDAPDVEAPTSQTEQMELETDEHAAVGTIAEVDKSRERLVVSHGPVPALEWPAMTMQFSLADPQLLDELKAGDEIRFSFIESEYGYVIRDLRKE